MNKKKKIIIISGIIVAILISILIVIITTKPSKQNKETPTLKELPKPAITGGARGELGIDKNINESTIDEYLNRSDSVYRDMRMLKDPGDYEAIGGDSYLSGYIEGFEIIPLPYIIPVTGLPDEVGNTYTGTTLFYNDNGTYIANYEESMEIIEKIFPKDKVIFLMCGGGGYAGMTKNFLVSMGWDENKIYNTGGYWYYKGNHNIIVKKEENGETTYDFDNVPYHEINFDKLTKTTNYKEPIVKVSEIKLNTSKLEIEEGTSFKLNAIVLPNDAINKEIKWTSSDETVATVTNDGLVKAKKAGTAIITVQTTDGDKYTRCTVIVNPKSLGVHVKLDDISDIMDEFESYNLTELELEFNSIVLNPDGTDKEGYYVLTENGGHIVNDLWREEYEKYEKKVEYASKQRSKIFNKLINDKKSFIILIHTKECEAREYSVLDGAKRILNQYNIQYLNIGTGPSDGDMTLENSPLDLSNLSWGSIAIIKDGKIIANINPDADTIKSDAETKNWLSKYIDIE